jgi:hypothetical protein
MADFPNNVIDEAPHRVKTRSTMDESSLESYNSKKPDPPVFSQDVMARFLPIAHHQPPVLPFNQIRRRLDPIRPGGSRLDLQRQSRLKKLRIERGRRRIGGMASIRSTRRSAHPSGRAPARSH